MQPCQGVLQHFKFAFLFPNAVTIVEVLLVVRLNKFTCCTQQVELFAEILIVAVELLKNIQWKNHGCDLESFEIIL